MKNSKTVVQFPHSDEECALCGSSNVIVRQENEEFPAGIDDDQVRLHVTVPVHYCLDCEFMFTGDEARKIRHEAVCRHLGVMTPAEIKGIRQSFGLSQAKFLNKPELA